MAPCSGTAACLESTTLSVNTIDGKVDFYSNYPIYLENAEWEKLKYAVIVVHGQSRNADDYFSYLTATLADIGAQDSTILIAPHFKKEQDSQQDLYWPTSSGWREGQVSSSDVKLSSFAVVDSLVDQLNNDDHFPLLEKIIVTGHSSGGLFTHLYGASNTSERDYPGKDFEYIVANSQYFYYPSDHRYDENSKAFYVPDNCTGFNFWPLGFLNGPAYLDASLSEEEFNSQFINRNITYLLGNGAGADGSLNTTNCAATLLGTSRYQRGENIFTYMNTFFSDNHLHTKTIVNGVGHDGEGMYKSPEFSDLLLNKLH
jgi:hypothetical protein